MRFSPLLLASLLLTGACNQPLAVNTPATPPNSPTVVSNSAPAQTNAKPVDPTPTQVAESDTTARPGWLQARIQAVLAERKRNPTIHIYQYQYRGQKVYYQSAPCCDQYSYVFDAKGKVLCNPDGGITGKGDGKCANFEKEKTDEKLVWQDPR